MANKPLMLATITALSLDNTRHKKYHEVMSLIRRTIEIDETTDTRLAEIAAERGQDIATVLADAVALLDSVIDLEGPDVAEDRRRLDNFIATGEAIPFDEVTAWVASWNTPDELPPPTPRKIS
jgi:predicted transcriptional regulator